MGIVTGRIRERFKNERTSLKNVLEVVVVLIF